MVSDVVNRFCYRGDGFRAKSGVPEMMVVGLRRARYL